MERNQKMYIYLWNKNDFHWCISIFSLIFLIIFYGTERNETEKNNRHLWNKNIVHGCFSIFCLTIICYIMEWNGTEKPIDNFGIKTMFTGVSQSLI